MGRNGTLDEDCCHQCKPEEGRSPLDPDRRDRPDREGEQGAEVEELRLADLDVRYCRFCMTCYTDTEAPIGTCPQDDDMRWILPALREADGYILGTQVSSGHADAIMKTFIERCA
jgi:multimeric flavodoxin WrbA